MASAKPRRDRIAELRAETAASRAARERRLREAIRSGALGNYLSLVWRRELSVERASLGLWIQSSSLFVREIEAPVLNAVAGVLGSIERPVLTVPSPGTPLIRSAGLLPPPAAMPPAITTALDRVFSTGGRTVLARILDGTDELAGQQVAFEAKALVRTMGVQALPDVALARVDPAGGPEPERGALLPAQAQNTADQITQRATSAPMFGQTVDKAYGKSLGGLRDRVESKIGEALQRGATNDEIVRMLRGTKAQRYTDGVLGGWRANTLKMFVRTVATHVTAQSSEASFAALGFEYVQLLAVLDLRTTAICISLDKEIYPIGVGPRPPLHPGCRTTVVPSPAATSTDREEYGGTRASKDGRIPSVTTAKDWWFGLPPDEQVFHVGPTRAAALRSGRITWEQLFGPGFEPLTNAQLRARGLLPAA